MPLSFFPYSNTFPALIEIFEISTPDLPERVKVVMEGGRGGGKKGSAHLNVSAQVVSYEKIIQSSQYKSTVHSFFT